MSVLKELMQLSRGNRIRGRRAKAYGDQFERLIELSCRRYRSHGKAYISKTFPAFAVVRRHRSNEFTGRLQRKGQPDFVGTLKNGRSIVFEVKHTNSTLIPFNQLAYHQKVALKQHYDLGAMAFILIAFKLDDIYKIPIKDWLELEKNIGKKSVNEKDLAEYKLSKDKGMINFLEE